MDAALRKCFWSGADAVRIIGELGAAVSPAPVQTHFCKREGSGGTIVDPMAIAENHQRFSSESSWIFTAQAVLSC